MTFELDGRKVVAQTLDLSRHGIFVRTNEQVPIGASVPLTIVLPQGPVSMLARVAHVVGPMLARDTGRPCGLGCALSSPTLEQRTLDRFVSEVTDVRVVAPVVPGTRVVLAEPQARALDRLSSLLREAGFVVEESFDGSDAYTACLEQPPDVLVLTEHMPGLDGWTVINKLAERPRTAGIAPVLLSQDPSDGTRLRAYRMGVHDFVVRAAAGLGAGVSDEELVLRIRRLAWLLRRPR
ncbi:MAG: response regulator [Deltaproteobacteria bacterium]|nr:response regulator [Deltaproteobacteria bacterium]